MSIWTCPFLSQHLKVPFWYYQRYITHIIENSLLTEILHSYRMWSSYSTCNMIAIQMGARQLVFKLFKKNDMLLDVLYKSRHEAYWHGTLYFEHACSPQCRTYSSNLASPSLCTEAVLFRSCYKIPENLREAVNNMTYQTCRSSCERCWNACTKASCCCSYINRDSRAGGGQTGEEGRGWRRWRGEWQARVI